MSDDLRCARVLAFGTTRVRVTGRPGAYRAEVWCDCLLGPHWHRQEGTWRTLESLYGWARDLFGAATAG